MNTITLTITINIPKAEFVKAVEADGKTFEEVIEDLRKYATVGANNLCDGATATVEITN